MALLIASYGLEAVPVPWDSPDSEEYEFKPVRKKIRRGPKSNVLNWLKDGNQAPQFQEINVPLEAIVIITGSNGSGSGFVAKMKKRDSEEDIFFVVSNIHVIAPNKNINYQTAAGETLNVPDKIFVSENRDLAMISIPPREHYLEVIDDFDSDVKIGDDVFVYGNASGAKVAARIQGVVLGVGPDRFEVDAKFVEGNSGSPIFHFVSGKVIGVASYVLMSSRSSPIVKDSRFSKPRRFAFRLESGSGSWLSATHRQLNEQYELFQTYKSKTDDLTGIVTSLGSRRLSSNVNDSMLERLIVRFRDDFGWGHYDTPGNRSKFVRLKKDLALQMNTDTRVVMKSVYVPFYRERIEENMTIRETLQGMLEDLPLPLRKH